MSPVITSPSDEMSGREEETAALLDTSASSAAARIHDGQTDNGRSNGDYRALAKSLDEDVDRQVAAAAVAATQDHLPVDEDSAAMSMVSQIEKEVSSPKLNVTCSEIASNLG